ncbi:HAD family hydrolase [Candidatus Bathyarchaeota archaeon]|nr:HAD family hydrolase [Candidatus Bathyarchaeota archaeon]
MTLKEYLKLNLENGEAYIRRDRISQIKEVDGIIFDCDGVLIDIRESYNKAISKSAAYILEKMTGFRFPEDLFSNEIIHMFRATGGFNDDWDTVYGIIMFTLSKMPSEIRKRLTTFVEEAGFRNSPIGRLRFIENCWKKIGANTLDAGFLSELVKDLKDFIKLLDSTGRRSVDENLLKIHKQDADFQRFHMLLKRFLNSKEVGRSVIATVFEELFCGARLFKEAYGINPRINMEPGLIENERLIVKPKHLDSLISILGRKNLGIASGSRRRSAEYILGELIKKFNPKSLVFAEDVEAAERLLKKPLKKPHPYSLLRAAEGFGKVRSIIYVGDSMEDAIMASRAREEIERVIFAGVYRYTIFEEEMLRIFLKYRCDIILPTVNELPSILEMLGRGKN